ncbi:MAG: hypothetical protein FJZ92_00065 [Chloroflexi bacterium]|nr:hypothetical protein [Chloroflexota bacterium]
MECSEESPLPVPPQMRRHSWRFTESTADQDSPPSSLRKSPAGCVPASTTAGCEASSSRTCQTAPTEIPMSGSNARPGLRCSHVAPSSSLRETEGPHAQRAAPAKSRVGERRESAAMCETVQPAITGSETVHGARRASDV